MEPLAIFLTAFFGWIGIALLVGLLCCGVPAIRSMIQTINQKKRSSHARLVAAGIDVTKLDIPGNATAFEIERMLRNGWGKHVQQRAEERVALENSTSYGEPIWLSLYAKRGSLKHWAILIHRQKYELRRIQRTTPPDSSEQVDRDPGLALNERNEVHREPIDDVSNSSGFGRYYEKTIREDLSYDQTMEAREEAIKAGRKPEARFFYILHVGWTRKTREEVDAACLEVEQKFGTYNIIANNCQNFAQRLAAQVVNKKSEDWDWFQRLSPTTYDYERPETIGPPGGVAKLCIDKLNKAKAIQQTTDPQMLQAIDQEIELLERYLRGLEPSYTNTQKRKSLWSDTTDEGAAFFGLCMLPADCLGWDACPDGCMSCGGDGDSGAAGLGGDAGAG